MFSHSCNGTNIFIWWKMKCSIQLGFASVNGTFHLSPQEKTEYWYHRAHNHSLFVYCLIACSQYLLVENTNKSLKQAVDTLSADYFLDLCNLFHLWYQCCPQKFNILWYDANPQTWKICSFLVTCTAHINDQTSFCRNLIKIRALGPET